jgi:hypothetical protein
VGFLKKSGNFGGRKCLGEPRKSFVELPSAIRFLQISRERVFQQPQVVSAHLPMSGLSWDRLAIKSSKRSRKLLTAKFLVWYIPYQYVAYPTS